MKSPAVIAILMALAPVSVLAEGTTIEYNRSEWTHWIQDDDDCQDLRQEVLIEESIITPITTLDGCKVQRGLWWDLFTGAYFSDPTELDIDHLVPLKEAHLSGGWQWDHDKKGTMRTPLIMHTTLSPYPDHLTAPRAQKTPLDGFRPTNKHIAGTSMPGCV